MAEPEVVDSEVLSTADPAAKDEAAEVDVTAKPSPAPRLKKLRREQEKTDTGEEAGVSVGGGQQVVKQGDFANMAHPPPAHLPALLHLSDVTATSPLPHLVSESGHAALKISPIPSPASPGLCLALYVVF